MADYPLPAAIPQIIGSARISDDGTVLDQAESGKTRLRNYFTQVRYQFTVLHDVDGPDKDTILAHYAANKAITFNFTFAGDSVVYNCRYTQVPNETPTTGTDRWRVLVNLVVV